MRISDWSSDVCSSDLLEARVIDEIGARPAAFDRAFGEARGNVESGERIGGGGDGLAGLQCRLDQVFEMRGLGGERVRARLPDLERGLVQIGGVETHHARQRLAVGEEIGRGAGREKGGKYG